MSEPRTLRALAPSGTAQRLTRQLSRRGLLAGVGGVGLLGALAGCGRATTFAASPPPDGRMEDKLNVYSWGDYDNPDNITAFRTKNDIVVQMDAFGSNEEMIAKLSATRGTSGYDVVVPTGLVIPQMAEHHLLQRLDKSLLPHLANLAPAFAGQPFDRHNDYSVCKNWGTTGYVYDTHAIRGRMSSWKDFVTAATTVASTRTALLQDSWEVCAIALGAAGADLNATDAATLQACRHTVVDVLAPHVRAYVGASAPSMGQGSFTLLHSYNGDARQGMLAAKDRDRWRFVFPTPHANIWMDNWCIATGAPHPDAAHAFIDFMLTDDAAKAEVDYIGYPTGTKILDDPAVQKGFDLPELIFPAHDVVERFVASEYNDGIGARVDILAAAQARSGA